MMSRRDEVTGDLFGDFTPAPAPLPVVPPQAPPRRRAGEMQWHLTDHACRHCLGRVLKRMSRGVITEVRCAECGAEALGDHTAVCCCGAQAGSSGSVLECVRNPDRTKGNPQEILVRERRQRDVAVAVERRKARPVKVDGF
jgi:hypothetical protein